MAAKALDADLRVKHARRVAGGAKDFVLIRAEWDAKPLVHSGEMVQAAPEPLNLAALDQPGERLISGVAARSLSEIDLHSEIEI